MNNNILLYLSWIYISNNDSDITNFVSDINFNDRILINKHVHYNIYDIFSQFIKVQYICLFKWQ
jgi:hypothetical protein